MTALDAALRDAVADATAPIHAALAGLTLEMRNLQTPIAPMAYRLGEAAKALQVHRDTVSKMIASGDLATVVLPGMTERRIPAAALAELVASERWQYRSNVVPFTASPVSGTAG